MLRPALRCFTFFSVLAGLVLLGPSLAFSQISENNTQPEPVPEPRFPTPRADAADFNEPDDADVPEGVVGPNVPPLDAPPASLPPANDRTPASLPPAVAAPRLVRGPNTTEVVGRIKRLDDLRLTIDPSVEGMEDLTFVIAPEAEVFLNKKPVGLDSLEQDDYVRLTLSNEVRGVILRIWAARVTDDPRPDLAVTHGSNNTGTGTQLPAIPPDPTRQGALGVVLSDSPNEGVLVVNVDQDGPAGSVGLAIGDYLMGLDRRVVMTPEDAIATLMRYAPRTTVIMTVWRQGKTLTQPVVLGTQQAFPDQVAEDPRPYLAAATRMDATPKILTALGLELANTQSGPQIVSVDLGSPAEGIGLRKSDVILGIDGVKTANAAAVTEAIRKQPADNNLTFTVLRDGRQKNLTLRLNQPPVSAPTVPTGNNSASQ